MKPRIKSTQKRPRPKSQRSKSGFFTDASLIDPCRDELNFLPFATQLATTIASRKDPLPLILGIYGEWGTGKTTLLNFVKDHLDKDKHVICFHFNPWRFPDEIALIRFFFVTLAGELNRRLKDGKQTVGKALSILGKIIPPFSGYGIEVDGGKSVEALGKMLTETSVENEKARVEEILQQEMKRVVILIDDIDRMDNAEIQALFKLIKLSANFSYVTYVLALDDDLVAEALSVKYGTAGIEAGRKFLEKIVQVPLQMPSADVLTLRTFTFNRIQSVLDDQNIIISDDNLSTYMVRYITGLQRAIRTPRLAKQYANALAFSLPLLNNEVDTVDLMVLEGIRIAYPKLYKEIRKNKHIFLGTVLDQGTSPENMKKRAEDLLEASLKDLALEEEVAAKGAITELFPRLRAVLNGQTFTARAEEFLAKQKKLASEEYFDRYFTYCVPKHDFSDQDVISLVNDSDSSMSNLDTILGKISEESSEAFLMKLSRFSNNALPAVASNLAIVLARRAKLFERLHENRLIRVSGRTATAIVVSDLLLQTPADLIVATAQRILEESSSITLALDCISIWLKPQIEKTANPISLTADERLKLIKALVKRIEDSNSDQPLYQLSGENTIQLYMFWAANKEVAGVTSEEAFGRALVNNSNEALAIIKCFMTESVSSTEGRQKMFSRDKYRALSSVVRPDIIVEHLRNKYVKSLDVQLTGNNDRAYPKTDAELVRFFYYLWDTEPRIVAAEGKA